MNQTKTKRQPLEAVCLKCGKALSFVAGQRRSIWVHDDTGNYMSEEPVRHDANTHFQLKAVAR